MLGSPFIWQPAAMAVRGVSKQDEKGQRRCPLCWPLAEQPPYEHVPHPKVPHRKAEIIQELLDGDRVEPGSDGYQMELARLHMLTCPELAQKLKTMKSRGRPTEPHPGNPMVGATRLRKAELEGLCAKHGIVLEGRTTIPKMLELLRGHWEWQCVAAGSVSPSSSTSSAWSLIGDQPMVSACPGGDRVMKQVFGWLRAIQSGMNEALSLMATEAGSARPNED